MITDYEVMVELCKTGEVFGLTCPVCKSPMLICETDRRLMICKKWTEEDTCTSCLITMPSFDELKEAVSRSKVVLVATRTDKQVKVGVVETVNGKRWTRRLQAYKITGRPSVFVRDPDGEVLALRFLKRNFGLDRFTESVIGDGK